MKHDKYSLIKVAKENYSYFTSVSEWNKHAIENGLPRAMSFAYHFGSWNKAKKALDIDSITHLPFTLNYSREQLIQIAKGNKQHFTKTREWNYHSKNNNLPLANTYIYEFGSWKKAKSEIFNIETSYTKQRLMEIALNNQSAFTSISNWNKHATEHHLPSSKYYERYFGTWNKAKSTILNNSTYSIHERPGPYTKNELMDIAKQHKEHFRTKKHWDSFAREMELPCAETFSINFKGWKTCKSILFK